MRVGAISLDLLDSLARQELTLRDLCDDTGRDSVSVGEALIRLLDRGLVSRRKSGVNIWSITREGRDVLRDRTESRGRAPGVTAFGK